MINPAGYLCPDTGDLALERGDARLKLVDGQRPQIFGQDRRQRPAARQGGGGFVIHGASVARGGAGVNMAGPHPSRCGSNGLHASG